MSLPQDKSICIMNCDMTGIEFEDSLFQQLLLHYSNVTFNTTDLAGKPRILLTIKFKYFKIFQDPPVWITDDVILRCYKGYPRIDFILRCTFIYLSINL